MKKEIFRGSGVAIVTPYNQNGIDYKKLEELLEFHIAHKTDAIIICGTTGESATMTDSEHRDAIRFTVEKVNGRIPVVGGAGSNDTAYAVDLAKNAKDAGCDGILCVTPYYNKTTQHGLVKHFTMIADATDIPVILYNVPSRTGLNIKPETYYELSKHPNIVGIKEANGNISDIAKTRALCGDEMMIYSGNDDQIVPILSLGGIGVISVAANILPEVVHDICESYFTGDVKKSMELQLKYLDIMNALFVEVNPVPVKTAMNLMGFDVGILRMPLCEMLPANEEKLKASMKALSLL